MSRKGLSKRPPISDDRAPHLYFLPERGGYLHPLTGVVVSARKAQETISNYIAKCERRSEVVTSEWGLNFSSDHVPRTRPKAEAYAQVGLLCALMRMWQLSNGRYQRAASGLQVSAESHVEMCERCGVRPVNRVENCRFGCIRRVCSTEGCASSRCKCSGKKGSLFASIDTVEQDLSGAYDATLILDCDEVYMSLRSVLDQRSNSQKKAEIIHIRETLNNQLCQWTPRPYALIPSNSPLACEKPPFGGNRVALSRFDVSDNHVGEEQKTGKPVFCEERNRCTDFNGAVWRIPAIIAALTEVDEEEEPIPKRKTAPNPKPRSRPNPRRRTEMANRSHGLVNSWFRRGTVPLYFKPRHYIPPRSRISRGAIRRHKRLAAEEKFWSEFDDESISRLFEEPKPPKRVKPLPKHLFKPSSPAIAPPVVCTDVKVGGPGDCWKKVYGATAFIDGDRLDVTSKELYAALITFGTYLQEKRGRSTAEWFFQAKVEEDGDIHVEDVMMAVSKRLQLKCYQDPTWLGWTEFIYLLKFTEKPTPEPVIVGRGKVVGAIQQMDDIAVIKGAPAAISTVATSFWDYARSVYDNARDHFNHDRPVGGVPSLPQDPSLPLPGPSIPTPPGLPCPAPRPPVEDMPSIIPDPDDYGVPINWPFDPPALPDHGNLEEMPTFYQWYEVWFSTLSEATQDFIRHLTDQFGDASRELVFFFGNIKTALVYLVQRAEENILKFLEVIGFGAFPQLLSDIGSLLSDLFSGAFGFVNTVATSVIPAATWVLLGVKLFALLSHRENEFHGADEVYRMSVLRGNLKLDAVHPVGDPQWHPHHFEPIGPSVLERQRTELYESMGDGRLPPNLPALLTTHTLPVDTPPFVLDQFQKSFSDASIGTGRNPTPHPRLSLARNMFRRKAAEVADQLQVPIHLVGGANSETVMFQNVVHNCAPILTGRDYYRHFLGSAGAEASYRLLSHNHKFQECSHVTPFPQVNTNGSLIVSLFSAHDIPIDEFARAMATNRSSTAMVSLNLPFPLLDERVKCYTDELVGLRYEREGDKLMVYHIGEHTGGYCHDFASVKSWMSNPPVFKDCHLMTEAILQIGTSVLLKVTLAPGKPEVVPTMWSTQTKPFYILPVFSSIMTRKDETDHIVIPRARFEQLVAYVSTLDPVDRTFRNVISKIRGLMAEIRVGKMKVEPRWEVGVAELYSLAHHALMANYLLEPSAEDKAKKMLDYWERQRWRNGTYVQRKIQGYCDAFKFRLNGEEDPLSPDTWFERFFRNKLDNTHTYNPYHLAGQYRLVPTNITSDLRNYELAASSVKSSCFWLGSKAVQFGRAANKVLSFQPKPHIVLPARPRSPDRDPDIDEVISESDSHAPTARTPGSFTPYKPGGVLQHGLELYTAADVPLPPSEPSVSSVETQPQARIEKWLKDVPDPPVPTTNAVEHLSSESPQPRDKGKGRARPEDLIETPRPPPSMSLPSVTSSVAVSLPLPVRPKNYRVDAVARAGEPVPKSISSASQPAGNRFDEGFEIVHGDVPPVDNVLMQSQLKPPQPPDKSVDIQPFLEDQIKEEKLYSMDRRDCSPYSNRVMDFFAPIGSLEPLHPADDRYLDLFGRALPKKLEGELCCPSTGGLDLLQLAVSKNTPTRLEPLTEHLNMVKVYREHYSSNAKIREKFNNLVKCAMGAKFGISMTIVGVEGPAMSAKSTLVRAYIARSGYSTVVVTPSHRLKEDWKEHLTKLGVKALRCVARHGIPAITNFSAQLLVMDEIFNFDDAETRLILAAASKLGVKKVILLGDRFQCERTCLTIDHPFLNDRIHLQTSLGMPRDAHAIFKRVNNLGPEYDTTGKRCISVFFGSPRPPPTSLALRMFTEAKAPPEFNVSIGQAQGLRPSQVSFYQDSSLTSLEWMNVLPNRVSVSYTRHTEFMYVQCSIPSHPIVCAFPLVVATAVSGRHFLAQNSVDTLFSKRPSQKVESALDILRALTDNPIANDCPITVQEVDDFDRCPSKVIEVPTDIRNAVATKTQFDLPDPDSIDLEMLAPVYPAKFSRPPAPLQPRNVRSDIEDANLMAAIHVNKSSFDSCKNLFDRNLGTSKLSRLTSRQRRHAAEYHDRFKECYYADKYDILPDVDATYNWLAERLSGAINMLTQSEPFGETGRSLSCDAEFKTQSKAKAVQCFAATLPYGQSIIANAKVFNLRFALAQQKAYFNGSRLMRPGIILDYGLTDDQLSDKIRKLGLGELFTGPKNLQADVSKQDSSHTPEMLMQFLLFLKDCGVSDEDCELYLCWSSSYRIKSRDEAAVSGLVSFNLGSGDPWTLIRNDIMELLSVACKFRHADTAYIVEKGDDVHGWIENLAPHPFAARACFAGVILKIEMGAVPYHAGRFHNGTRYLVDPIRAFMKHLTRLPDVNVTVKELYQSYISRATDYSTEEVEFLKVACPMMYPFFSGDECANIIAYMLKLRNYKFFTRSYPTKPVSVVLDPRKACVSQCVRLVRPNRTRNYYRQFLSLSIEEVSKLLSEEGIAHVVVDNLPSPIRLRPGVLYVSKKHCVVRL